MKLLLGMGFMWGVGGCHHYYRPRAVQPPMMGLMEPTPVETVQAMVTAPVGWKMEPLKSSERHMHQIWVSPSGETAFGAIRFRLPLPIGPSLLMGRFLAEMRRLEQTATVISREEDAELPGIRFVAEGGIHTVRVNLITHGFRGWAFYAGTYTGEAENKAELELAERAREASSPGLPADYREQGTRDMGQGTSGERQ
ncbi:MAG TPA: hypothetical protein VGQ99_04810 [Tepidisphaeraceae bacterium]|nr:hypothetical protein [Tepidisphaeraceae bacterium]